MKHLFLLTLALNSLFSGFAQTEHYEIDAEHSFVYFTVNRFGMVDVSGRFDDFSGAVTLDGDFVDVSVTVKTASVNSGMVKRDDAIRSSFLLDSEDHPEMSFVSSSVSKDEGSWVLAGDLTIHGVTKMVALPFKLKPMFKDPTGAVTIALKGSFSINRQDYGLAFDQRLENGEPFVGNEIEIRLDLLAVQKP